MSTSSGQGLDALRASPRRDGPRSFFFLSFFSFSWILDDTWIFLSLLFSFFSFLFFFVEYRLLAVEPTANVVYMY